MIDALGVAAPQLQYSMLARFLEEESAQDMIEYALIAAFLGLGTVTGVHGLAAVTANYLNAILNAFNGALAGHL